MTDEDLEIPLRERMISARDAGQLLGISSRSVLRMMEDDEFGGYLIGNAFKFKYGEIVDYRESRRYLPKKKK